jgi:hypothetical protein
MTGQQSFYGRSGSIWPEYPIVLNKASNHRQSKGSALLMSENDRDVQPVSEVITLRDYQETCVQRVLDA